MKHFFSPFSSSKHYGKSFWQANKTQWHKPITIRPENTFFFFFKWSTICLHFIHFPRSGGTQMELALQAGPLEHTCWETVPGKYEHSAFSRIRSGVHCEVLVFRNLGIYEQSQAKHNPFQIKGINIIGSLKCSALLPEGRSAEQGHRSSRSPEPIGTISPSVLAS